MASDRVKKALGAFAEFYDWKIGFYDWGTGADYSSNGHRAMSAALGAADAVALTPAQREAEGMLAVLRDLVLGDDAPLWLFLIARQKALEILARIDGGK
jgi:hypothetical protein